MTEILAALYASEIGAQVGWQWDAGIEVRLGSEYGGWLEEETFLVADLNDPLPDFDRAAAWLRDVAVRHYPDSDFARKYG